MGFMVIALVGAAAYFFASPRHGSFGVLGCCVAAMLGFGFVVASRLDHHRAAWIVILLGQACFLIGDVCFSLLEHVFHSDAYPERRRHLLRRRLSVHRVGLVMLLRLARHVARRRRRDRRLHRRHERRCAAVGVLRRADGFRPHAAVCSNG